MICPGGVGLVLKHLVPSAKRFNAHLKAVQIPKLDGQGRVMDFHSLRHTFCTNLHLAGVPQREAMELMRHSDPRLTANTDTDASRLSLKPAVEKLTVSPSQIASQILGATSQTVTPPDAQKPPAKAHRIIAKKGDLAASGAASRSLAKIGEWCLSLMPLELFFKNNPHLEAMGIEPFRVSPPLSPPWG